MTDPSVKVRITGESSTLATAAQEGTRSVEAVGESAARANARIAASVADAQSKIEQLARTGGDATDRLTRGYDVQAASLDRAGESLDQQTARLRAVVQASAEAARSAGGVQESQRSLAERAGESTDALSRQSSAAQSAAAAQEGMRLRVEALNAAEARRAASAEASTGATKTESDSLAKLLGQIDPVIAKLNQLDALEERLKAARRSGAIGAEDYAVYSRKLTELRAAAVGAGEGMSHLTLNSAGARRELGVLIGEVARGNFAALEGSTITLANRTGLLSAAFTGTGAAITSVLGIAAGLIALYAASEARTDAFNRSLEATGNYAGSSDGQLRNLVSTIGAQTGAYREADEAVLHLVSSGRLAGTALEDAARGAVALAELTGESATKTAAEFEKLADDPVRAILKLDETYHFLTTSVYDQIKALQDQGNEEAATSLAVRTAADVFEQRSQKVVENIGLIARAARNAKGFVTDLLDAISNIGKDATNADQLDALYGKRADIESQIADLQSGSGFGSLRPERWRLERAEQLKADLAGLDEQIGKLRDIGEQQARNDADAARQNNLREEALAASVATDRLSLSLDKNAQKAQAIADLNARFSKMFEGNAVGSNPRLAGVLRNDDGSFSGGLYDKQLAEINEKFTDKGAARKAAADQREIGRVMSELNTEIERGLKLSAQLTDEYDGPLDAAANRYTRQLETLGAAYEALQAKAGVSPAFAASPEYQAQMDAIIAASEAAGEQFDATADKANARDKAILSSLATNAKYEQSVSKMTERERALALAGKQASDYFKQHEEVFKKNGVTLEQYTAKAQAAAGVTFTLSQADDIVRDQHAELPYAKELAQLEKLKAAIELVGDKTKETFDPDRLKAYEEAQARVNQQVAGMKLEQAANAVAAGLTSLQSLADEGSESYARMKVAIDAANIAAAIGAIVNQGMGDPYTAFARIAAMAALMATFVGDLGAASGAGFKDVAGDRQKTQGTGTVLGDADAKSESIANATAITANATQELVGINRGMLVALQSLQAALGAAGNQLARGAGDVPTPALSGPSGLQMTPIGSALESFFLGGSQKIVDEGIVIAGGYLGDMLQNIVVGAYQTIETDGGLFHSDKISEKVSDVSAGFKRQFELVIGSIVDTVREGALALGVLPEDIEAAIARFKVEEIRISLKGLSAEDQQKELEAVFSSIFDGLAGEVVPFIAQFQRVGEGLGETLVRVATEVQVVQEGFKQLGIAVDETDPEKFAQLSDALIQASGGIDEFISGMRSFVQNFSTDAHQLDVSSAALTSAFAQVGLTLPSTRDGMWELMQSLDATTEQGQKQIATLLRLSDVANQYYDDLDSLGKTLGLTGMPEFKRQLLAVRDSAAALIQALQRAGATTQQLQQIQDAAVNRMKALIEELRSAARAEAFDLNLTNTGGSLDQVNAEIAELQGIASSAAGSVSGFGSAMTDAANRASDAINLLIGDKSPLNDLEKLEVARGGLIQGTVTQEQFLEIARRLFGSTRQYETEFAFAQRYPGRTNGGGGGGGGSAASPGLTAEQSQRLSDLLEQQKQLQAADTLARYRDVAEQYAQLAQADRVSFIDELKADNIDLQKFAEGLGLDGEEALKAYGENLQKQLDAQGDSTQSIVDAIYWLGDTLTGVTHPHGDDSAPVSDDGHSHGGPHDGTTIVPDDPHHSTRELPPSTSAGAGIDFKQVNASTADTASTMKDVRTLIAALVTTSSEGNAELVSTLRDNVTITAEVRDALSRLNLDVQVHERR